MSEIERNRTSGVDFSRSWIDFSRSWDFISRSWALEKRRIYYLVTLDTAIYS